MITAKGHIEIIDTEYSIRTALSIADNGSLLIDPPDVVAVQNFAQSETTNKIYSPYGIGLSLIFIPFVISSELLAWLTGLEVRPVLDFVLSFYNIPFAILGLYFFQKITLILGASTRKSIFMTLCLGIGTCYWKYTVTDFSEIAQSCLLLGIIYTMFFNGKNKWYKLSFLYSLIVLLKLTYIIYFPFLIIYFTIDNLGNENKRIIRNFLHSCTFIVPIFLFIAYLNFFRFDNVFESGYGSTIKFSFDFFVRDWFGYLFSFDRGLLTFNPILLISLVCFFFSPKIYRKPSIIMGFTIGIWYLTMCFWVSWQGGYCWGNRLLTPIVPLLLLPLVFLDFNTVLSKILLILTLIGSTIIQFAASFTKIHEIIEIKLKIHQLTEQIPHSQLWRGITLFFHKITTPHAEYLAYNFGVDNSELINLGSYKSFHGYNLWIVHLLNHFGFKTYTQFAGITILLVTILLCISILKIVSSHTRT